jgi:N-carbamoylputrescine amidase
MPRVVRCGLIQPATSCRPTASLPEIREAMIAKHLRMIDDAAGKGVQILCRRSCSTGPTSAPSRRRAGTTSPRRCRTARRSP